jgi:pimeloyl-ACP methyl ester carboxylesterase
MKAFNRLTIKLLTRLQRPGLKPLDPNVLDRWAADLDPGMKDAILRLYRSADPDVLGRHGAGLGKLTCPALILWGQDDPYVGIAEMDVMRDQLGGPIETRTIAGGHWCMWDTPEVFDRTTAFLTATRTAGQRPAAPAASVGPETSAGSRVPGRATGLRRPLSGG